MKPFTLSPKVKKYIWIAIGVIIAVILLSNQITQSVARKRTAELLTALQLVLPESTQVSASALPAGAGENYAVINNRPCIGELLLPALNIDTAVIGEYTKDYLKYAPCVYSGTVTGRDLIIVSGNYRTHLGAVNALIKGDTVMLSDMDGSLILYDVDKLEFADKETELTLSDGGYDLSLYCLTAGGTPRYVARCTLCD